MSKQVKAKKKRLTFGQFLANNSVKNIVKVVLESYGYKIIDLGKDVNYLGLYSPHNKAHPYLCDILINLFPCHHRFNSFFPVRSLNTRKFRIST